MNSRQIEVLRAVMMTGSISGGAAMLCVSQPAVSRLIRHLEIRLGVALFERIKGRLVPTPEAQTLYAEIEQAYKGMDRVRNVAELLRHGGQQRLRVASNLSTALEIVPAALAAVRRRHADAGLAVEVMAQSAMSAQLMAGQADIGVGAFLQLSHPLIRTVTIGHGQLLCALHRGHALAAKSRVTLADVAGQPQVSFGPETAHGQQLARLLATAEQPDAPLVEVQFAHVACSLVAHGFGLAIVDDLSAGAVNHPELALRPFSPQITYQLAAVISRERPMSVLGKTFLEALKVSWKDSVARRHAMRLAGLALA